MADHKIDDFTLRLIAGSKEKNFIVCGQTFSADRAKVIQGMGKVKNQTYKDYIQPDSLSDYEEATLPCTEVALRKGTIEWHYKNFKPNEELQIYSADRKYSLDSDYSPYSVKNIGIYYVHHTDHILNRRDTGLKCAASSAISPMPAEVMSSRTRS